MPNRDGSGPLGRGALTGRGLGMCNGVPQKFGGGLGRGLGRGFRNVGNWFGFGRNNVDTLTSLKDEARLLEQQMQLVQQRIQELENK